MFELPIRMASVSILPRFFDVGSKFADEIRSNRYPSN